MTLVLVDNARLYLPIALEDISQFLLRRPIDVSKIREIWYEVDLRDATNEEGSAEY